MRVLGSAIPFLVFPALLATAEAAHKIQAQQDQFNGPVRSISTKVVLAAIKWSQPSGTYPSLRFLPIA